MCIAAAELKTTTISIRGYTAPTLLGPAACSNISSTLQTMSHWLSRKVAFATATTSMRSAVVTRVSHKITIKSPVHDVVTTFDCEEDRYILDAAEAAGLQLPSSCRSGTCCTCAGKLVSGKVNQEEQNFLDDQQMEQGYALLCVSYPLSDCLVMSEQHVLNPLMK